MSNYQEIQRTDKMLFICPICGEEFRALAYHTRQKHGLSAVALRQKYGLKADYQLITKDLKLLHKEIALNNPEFANFQAGKHTRFERGHLGHIKDNWSPQALSELSTRRRKV